MLALLRCQCQFHGARAELDQQAIRESNEVRSKHELAELVETTQNTADDERRRRTRSQLRYPHALLRENRAEQLSLERRLARLEQKKVDKAREIDAMKRTFTTRYYYNCTVLSSPFLLLLV